MKWQPRYFAYVILCLCALLLSSCGVRKKQVHRAKLDSVHVKTEINTDYQRATITNLVTENKTIDLTQFEARIIDYDTSGRVTRETVIEQRTEAKTEQKQDSTVRDTTRKIESTKTDSASVQKKEKTGNKQSDTTWLRNIGQYTLLVLGGFAILAFFIYRLIKK